jgi:phage-related holin
MSKSKKLKFFSIIELISGIILTFVALIICQLRDNISYKYDSIVKHKISYYLIKNLSDVMKIPLWQGFINHAE